MLRAGLMRKHHDFLRAHPFGVHISDDFEPGLFQFTEPEIRHFNSPLLFGCNRDSGVSSAARQSFNRRLVFLLTDHARLLLRRRNMDGNGPAIIHRGCPCQVGSIARGQSS